MLIFGQRVLTAVFASPGHALDYANSSVFGAKGHHSSERHSALNDVVLAASNTTSRRPSTGFGLSPDRFERSFTKVGRRAHVDIAPTSGHRHL